MRQNISFYKLGWIGFIVMFLFLSQGLNAQNSQRTTEVFEVGTSLTNDQIQQIDSLLTAKEGIIAVEPGTKNGSFKVTYQPSLQKIRILDKFKQVGYQAFYRDDQGNKIKVGPDGTLQKINE